MIPVMCNCANNRHGQCYGNVNTAEIRELMEARTQDGSTVVTASDPLAPSTVFNERMERVVSQGCPGWVTPSGSMYAGVQQGDRKIDGDGNQVTV